MPNQPAGVGLLLDVIEAVAAEPGLRERVAEAEVWVRVEPADHPEHAVGVALRDGDAVIAGSDGCDVVLRLADDVLHDVLVGSRQLPMEILAGRVTYEGQVRRLLRVLPILRRIGHDLAGAERAGSPA